MVAYEILLMLDPELPDERQNEIVGRSQELVEQSGGTWARHDVWGRRKLAYEIDHKAEGAYHLVLFEAEPATLDELSRILKITDGVIRHMAVRQVQGSRPGPPPADREPEYSANTRSQPQEDQPQADQAPVDEPQDDQPPEAQPQEEEES